jgi:uncharacterized protein Veg
MDLLGKLLRNIEKTGRREKYFHLEGERDRKMEKIHNTKLNNLYSSCHIVRAIIARKVTMAEHVARIKKIKMHTLPDREGKK